MLYYVKHLNNLCFIFYNKETQPVKELILGIYYFFLKEATSRFRHCTGVAWSPIARYSDNCFFMTMTQTHWRSITVF